MKKSFRLAMALATIVASPPAAWAFGGIGCADLPEYDRATGALEGMPGACDMTVERARQIHAEHDGLAAVAQPTVPASRRHRRHRRAQ